jgi:hypothetical protein
MSDETYEHTLRCIDGHFNMVSGMTEGEAMTEITCECGQPLIPSHYTITIHGTDEREL